MRDFIRSIQDKRMRTFLWVWLGQFVSLLGSGMTRFGLMIWAYEQTGSATTLALLGTANYVPYLLASPLAGVVESLAVALGQSVNAGDKIMVIEAMKMKTPIHANHSGTVKNIAVVVGQAVEAGAVLMTIG